MQATSAYELSIVHLSIFQHREYPRDFITVKNVKTYQEKTKTTVMLGQRGGSFHEISVTAKNCL